MSREHDLQRRELLKLLVALPVGLTVGCKAGGPAALDPSTFLSPEESLGKLVQLLGPWTEAEGTAGERFAERFLAAPHAAGLYLPDSAELVQSLASRFSSEGTRPQEIDLDSLPPEEQELLLGLVKQLYSLVEVRFHVAGEPPWGQCPEDRLLHTLAPVDAAGT